MVKICAFRRPCGSTKLPKKYGKIGLKKFKKLYKKAIDLYFRRSSTVLLSDKSDKYDIIKRNSKNISKLSDDIENDRIITPEQLNQLTYLYQYNKFGNNLLTYAISKSSVENVKVLLDYGYDVNRPDVSYTPLIMSVININKNIFHLLMTKNPNINQQTLNGETLLMHCVKNDIMECVEFCISKGAYINIQDNNGNTPLLIATKEETDLTNIQMIKYLLDNGADVNIRDIDLNTPLHNASGYSDVILEWLLKYNADVNVKNKYGVTPLMKSLLYKKLDSAKTLIEHGANINDSDDNGVNVFMYSLINSYWTFEFMLNYDVNIYKINKFGQNALIFAARYGNIAALKYFLNIRDSIYSKNYNKNLNINYVDFLGDGALDAAMSNGKHETFKFLVEHGADINIQNKRGFSILMSAIFINDIINIQLLLDHNVDVNLADNQGNTALLFAIIKNIEIVQLLLKYSLNNFRMRIDINAVDNNGDSALMKAIKYNSIESVKLLFHYNDNLNVNANNLNVNANLDVNIKNKMGKTAIMQAIYYNNYNQNLNLVKLLIDKGANLNDQDNNGNTVLMHAARNSNNIEIFILLISSGASQDGINNEGLSVNDIILQNNNYKAIDYLNNLKNN